MPEKLPAAWVWAAARQADINTQSGSKQNNLHKKIAVELLCATGILFIIIARQLIFRKYL